MSSSTELDLSVNSSPVPGEQDRRIGLEASKTFDRKVADGFVGKYLSGPCILDIGYRGYSPDVEPIVPQAIGVELDYPGYDGRTLPFADGSQDAVFASHCLEHIDDFCNALREWHRVLRVGGYMVIAVPHQFLYEKRTNLPSRWNADHKRFYTPASLMSEVEQSLEPNTYRLRHLIDNDLWYDYAVPPSLHAGGCYEIELVLQRIAPPVWTLEYPQDPATEEPQPVQALPSTVAATPDQAEAAASSLQRLAGLYGKLRTLPRHIVLSLNTIAAEVSRQGQQREADKKQTALAIARVQAGIARCQNSVADALYEVRSSPGQSPALPATMQSIGASLDRIETLINTAQSPVAEPGPLQSPSGLLPHAAVMADRTSLVAGYDAARRLCFMHIPKSSGTALRRALEQALQPLATMGGFDHALFGGFTAFDTLQEAARREIYSSAAAMPRVPGIVAGHFAYATLREAYPDGQMMTVLREPVSRLLSHWAFWRKHADDGSGYWGGWADYVRHAQQPLHVFLAEPAVAAQTDNIALRMLLWPHPMVPDAGFIDPVNDRLLLTEARARLAGFPFADIMEQPGLDDRMQSWLGRAFVCQRLNQTEDMPPSIRIPFESQIGDASLDLLHQRSRLDLVLWQDLAMRDLSSAACDRLREQIILRQVARYGALMAAPS